MSGLILSSSTVSANDNAVDKVSIKVPVSCSMSGTGMNSHTAALVNGTYTPDVGTTTLHAFCNDSEGFAIYAAGYTGNEIGATNSNKLVGTSASNNATIDTGIATSAGNPDVSNWAMKLTATQDSGDTSGTNAFTIDSAPNTSGGQSASFSQYHVVPNEYTKVAHKNSATDMTASTGGVKLTTTYAAYISKTQVADTYSGKVIYTLVHPSDHSTPVAHPAVLDTGKTVNSKLKSLAATVVNGEETIVQPSFHPGSEGDWTNHYYIKSIVVHLETPAPAGFTPTEANTISSSASSRPIYIVFDNTNDAGIMHFYTEGEQIYLSTDASFMFYTLINLANISFVSDWNTSNTTNISYMFYGTGYGITYDTPFTLDLSSWDTSSVTDMSSMFFDVGFYTDTFTLDLSSWDTSSVTDMSYMFYEVCKRATTCSINGLSSWDTSSVMDMGAMFGQTGSWVTTWSIGDLSSWDTSSVTNMAGMFNGAGSSATTWSIGDLSSWDTSSVTNMANMFYYVGGHDAATPTLNLSSWDTSSVTNMNGMFSYAGYYATTFTLDISSWDVSSVTDMYNMFYYAGYESTTFTLDLSSWDTSSATNMGYMFYYAGRYATNFTLNLSSWDTSNVTSMSNMFRYAGTSASTWSITIPPTNGNNINNTTSRLYGKTTSTYGTPPSYRSFTLAQP